jgi:hypothetical protein
MEVVPPDVPTCTTPRDCLDTPVLRADKPPFEESVDADQQLI